MSQIASTSQSNEYSYSCYCSHRHYACLNKIQRREREEYCTAVPENAVQQPVQQRRQTTTINNNTLRTEKSRFKHKEDTGEHQQTTCVESPLRHYTFFFVHIGPPVSVLRSKCPSNVRRNPPKSVVVHRLCCQFCCQRRSRKTAQEVPFQDIDTVKRAVIRKFPVAARFIRNSRSWRLEH